MTNRLDLQGWEPEGYTPVLYTGHMLIFGENADKYVPVCKVALVKESDYADTGLPFPSVDQEEKFFMVQTIIYKPVKVKSWFRMVTRYFPVRYAIELSDELMDNARLSMKSTYLKRYARKS